MPPAKPIRAELVGDSSKAPHMARARGVAHRLGGLERSNSYVRFLPGACGARWLGDGAGDLAGNDAAAQLGFT
jgi:hypothetical protein